MLGKSLTLLFLLASAFFLSACAAETNFDLVVKKDGQEKEYSFTCDNIEDIAFCKKAERLLKKPDALSPPELLLENCPTGDPRPTSSRIEIWGRIKKQDVDALFFNEGTPCQEKRWQKILPLLRSLP